MEITTIKAVTAYKALKELKVNSLSDEAMATIWTNLKALRPFAETYDKDVEDVRKTLINDTYISMQSKLQKAQEKERAQKAGKYEMTDPDYKEIRDLQTWFADWNKKGQKFLDNLSNKVVSIDLEKLDSKELLQSLKETDKTFETMANLDWLIK